MYDDIVDRARSLQAQMVAWRRDIHRHPELGFRETRTSRLVAETLRALGLEVQVGVGKTGVVATIGEGTPVVGIRADMDALPIHEANTTDYTSETPGVMHACGHDAHTAILLGVAHMLAALPDRPPGQIRLLFQPSEEMEDDEDKSGAVRMIEDGALDGVDYVLALHVSSGAPSGLLEVRGGYVMAAVDTFFVTIRGEGGHGAYPHQTIDPIYIAAQVINAIHGVRARRINPMQPAVISVGAIHGGDADNVIPDQVRLVGTIRSYDNTVRQQLWAELERALGVARALGGDYTLHIRPGYPATYNDPQIAALLTQTAADLFGAGQLASGEPGMGAEDFGYMTQCAPGAMFFLGARLDSVHRPHHSPIFDIDESPLYIGSALLAQTALRLLRGDVPADAAANATESPA